MSTHRLPSLDVARGLSLIGMIAYHAAYDLSTYWGWDIDVDHGVWKIFARSVAVLFLLVSGMAMALSEERMQQLAARTQWKRRIRRAALTGGAALIVSLATYAADSDTYVRFGILHLAFVSRLLLPLFLSFGTGMIAVGAACMALASTQPWFGTPLLLPLGVVPHAFATVDYFPLVPWFGVVLVGAGVLRIAPVRTMLHIALPDTHITHTLQTAGRHTLLVYLLHQPLLLLIFRIMFAA